MTNDVSFETIYLRSCSFSAFYFPSTMHPDPLFGVAEEPAFEGGIVGTGIEADGFVGVVVFDQGSEAMRENCKLACC